MVRILKVNQMPIRENTNTEEFDVLYRGGDDTNPKFLWLSTSRLYAENYAGKNNKVFLYKVPISILDRLVDCKVIPDYLNPNCNDETPEYEPENYDVDRLVKDNYTGYYFYEDEYECLCVCLFKKALKYKLEGKQIPLM